ncbi:MAG: fuconate dehydratase, partial [Ktedonobacterales bacterium]|nr:fuconate dehydratase [Ktedonobacterales bacterium]
MTTIRNIVPYDLRFPTSESLAGSDAMHPDPDYSAAYVCVQTDGPLTGYGLTFTIGRGTEVICAAITALAPIVVGHTLEEIVMDWPTFWRRLTSDSQLRW